MLGQVLLVISHLHQAQVVALAVHQVHHLHNQIVEDRKVVLMPLFSFFHSCYNKGMNQYQKKIFKGTIYSLLSGLIWGICGILGEYFFTHYQVSSGWITSMRLTLAGSLVLIWSAVQLKSQVLDIWRDKKNYLPFLAYAILGIFSVQYFFYLCVEYSNAATATILQFISPVFILFLQSLNLSKTSVKKRYFLCFGCHVGCLLDGDKGRSLSVIHDATGPYYRFAECHGSHV